MKKVLFILFTMLTAPGINGAVFAQSINEMMNYSMSIFFGGRATASLTQSVEIDTGNNKAAVCTAMVNPAIKNKLSTDTSIVDATTLTSIYHSSFDSNHEYVKQIQQ